MKHRYDILFYAVCFLFLGGDGGLGAVAVDFRGRADRVDENDPASSRSRRRKVRSSPRPADPRCAVRRGRVQSREPPRSAPLPRGARGTRLGSGEARVHPPDPSSGVPAESVSARRGWRRHRPRPRRGRPRANPRGSCACGRKQIPTADYSTAVRRGKRRSRRPRRYGWCPAKSRRAPPTTIPTRALSTTSRFSTPCARRARDACCTPLRRSPRRRACSRRTWDRGTRIRARIRSPRPFAVRVSRLERWWWRTDKSPAAGAAGTRGRPRLGA